MSQSSFVLASNEAAAGPVKKDMRKVIYLLTVLISLMIYPYLNQTHPTSNIVKIPFIDDQIPLLTWMILPYSLYIPLLLFSIFWLVLKGKQALWFSLSFVLIQICSGLTYYFFQTYVPRPEIQGEDLFSFLLRLTYTLDKPYNCLPSTHVSLTMLSAIFWQKENYFRQNRLRSACMWLLASLIMISTVFVKQHYILDVLAGLALSILSVLGVGFGIRRFWLSDHSK